MAIVQAEFLDALFDRAPVGLGVFDRALRHIRVNPALAAMNGLPAQEILGRTPSELHGELGERTERLFAHVLETGEAVENVEVTSQSVGDPGVVRTWNLTYFPVPEGIGAIVVDVTERRAAEEWLTRHGERHAFIASAARALDPGRDVAEVAQQVAELAVPALADWAFVELLQDDGRVSRAGMAHVDPARVPWAQELARRYPFDPDSAVGSARVLRSGQVELLADVGDEVLLAFARDEEHLRSLHELGPRSLLILPLVAHGRMLGALTLAFSTASERRYGAEELATGRVVAELCALALDNARLYSVQASAARELMAGLLPPALPEVPGIELAARYRAAGGGHDVGGDFYDAIALRGCTLLVIGDVAGKGPAAAAVTGLVRHTLRAAARWEQTAQPLLEALNDAMQTHLAGQRYCTVAAVRIDPAAPGGTVAGVVTLAGHPPALVLRASGAVEPVGHPGHPIGALASPVLHDERFELRPGDTLLLYTDGATEGGEHGRGLGEDGLRDTLGTLAGQPAAELLARVEAAVHAAAGVGGLRDDVALLAVRVS